jgi:hypothetical protein
MPNALARVRSHSYDGDVHVARSLLPVGEGEGEWIVQRRGDGFREGLAKPGENRGQKLPGAFEEPKRFEMQVKVGGAGGPHRKRMDLRARQAEQIIKDQRMKRRRQLGKLRGRLVQLPALVGGRNDENAHIAAGGFFNARPVFLKDVIPVEIDIIEAAVALVANAAEDLFGRGVRGKADVAREALFLERARRGKAPSIAAGAQSVGQGLLVVDSMERQQVDIRQTQPLQGFIEMAKENGGIFVRDDLGLDNQLFAWKRGKDQSQLPLGGTIAAGRFNMGDADVHGATDDRFEVHLFFRRNLGKRHILPLVLVAHAPAGKDRHGQTGASEASILHNPPLLQAWCGDPRYDPRGNRATQAAEDVWPLCSNRAGNSGAPASSPPCWGSETSRIARFPWNNAWQRRGGHSIPALT